MVCLFVSRSGIVHAGKKGLLPKGKSFTTRTATSSSPYDFKSSLTSPICNIDLIIIVFAQLIAELFFDYFYIALVMVLVGVFNAEPVESFFII
jgi:hypothetical protein